MGRPFKAIPIAPQKEDPQAYGVLVSVVPMALTNLWGSYFRRIELAGGEPTAMVNPFRRGFFNRVGLNVGEPLPAPAVSPSVNCST